MKLALFALSLVLLHASCLSQANRSNRRSPPAPEQELGPIVESGDGKVGQAPDPIVLPKEGSVDNQPADPKTPDGPVKPGDTAEKDPAKPKPEPAPKSPAIVLGDVAVTTNPNLPFGLPGLSDQRPSIIISRAQYVLSWNQETHSVNWAAWKLDKSNLGKTPRREAFLVDQELKDALAGTNATAISSEDYTGSCFDRGHVVPSGDRTDTPENNNATFFMSNILPQTAFLNRIVWEPLESEARSLIRTRKHEQLWIIAGPIYKKKIRFIGKAKNVAVPDFTFKVIFTWDKSDPCLLYTSRCV